MRYAKPASGVACHGQIMGAVLAFLSNPRQKAGIICNIEESTL
jgi:hypothetical protein